MIKAKFKQLNEILNILSSGNYSEKGSEIFFGDKKLSDEYAKKLRAISEQDVVLAMLDPIAKTFEVSNQFGIIRESFSIGLLDEASIDTSTSDLFYGRCGFTVSGSSKYTYQPNYTWSEIIAGQSSVDEADAIAENTDTDGNVFLRGAISNTEGYYNDGFIMCPHCKSQHTFQPISEVFN